MTGLLPPLPPVPGVDDRRHRPDGATMFAQIGSDHAAIETLCCRITGRRDPAGRSELVDVLVATASRHLSAEEQYLYPTVRTVLPGGDEVADREASADVEIMRALADLHGAGPASFDRHLLIVLDLLRSHISRVQHGLFEELRPRLSIEDAVRLGNRIAIAREAAPTRPHPATPVTPPWNKVVDPSVGALDKVRDLIARRPTRTDNLPDPGDT